MTNAYQPNPYLKLTYDVVQALDDRRIAVNFEVRILGHPKDVQQPLLLMIHRHRFIWAVVPQQLHLVNSTIQFRET